MRWLIALLILVWALGGADAFPVRGGGNLQSCGPYVNGSTPGDTICPSTPSLAINDLTYGSWQFSGTQGSCPAGTGSFSVEQTSVNCASKMEFCNLHANAALTGLDAFQLPFSNSLPPFVVLGAFSNGFYDATALCAPANGFFLDGATAYNAARDSLTAASSGDTLTWRAAPTGIGAQGWVQDMAACIATANLTINMVSFGGNPFVATPALCASPPGQAALLINANGVTLNGGKIFANVKATTSSTNPVIENMTVTDGALGSSPFLSSCILTGGQNGTVTITSVVSYGCGDNTGAGQNHNLYVSVIGGASSVDNTCYSINGFTSLNVQYAGHSAKLRAPCGGGGLGDMTNSVLGCTAAGNASGLGCNQNTVVDYPCGGNHKLEHSVIEVGTGQALYNAATWYMMKFGEELSIVANCPGGDTVTHALVFDHDIFIEDNTTTAGGSFLCLVTQSGSSSCPLPAGTTCTVTNSQVISNTAAMGVAISLGNCTDGGGNSFYASRAAALAASAAGWSNSATYTDPTTGTVYNCCAFPFLPAHL